MQLSKKLSSLGLIGAAVAAAMAGMPAPAPAQDATPASSEELDEVLVTARRRSETFKDVPMTVNVFTAENIEAAGIDRPADFIARVPNMTLVETQNAGNAFVVIRGISADARTAVVRGVQPDGTAVVPLPKAERVIVTALDRAGRESDPVDAP